MSRKKKVVIAASVLVFLGFLIVIAWGERGAIDLYQLRLQRDRMNQTNLELQKDNEALFRAIQRLKHDLDFVEDIARRELGMVRQDEVVVLKKKR